MNEKIGYRDSYLLQYSLDHSISDTEEYEKSVKKDPYACVQQDVELRSHKVWGRVMFKNISLEVFCLWLAMTNTGFYHLKSSNSALEVAG